MALKPRIQEDLRKPKPVTLNGEEYRKPITRHTENPNLWLWMENIPGNPSLGTQETQTCDSEWIIFQETHHKAHRKPKLVTLNGEYSRKPNLWIRGNCRSCISTSFYFFYLFYFLYEYSPTLFFYWCVTWWILEYLYPTLDDSSLIQNITLEIN